MKTQYPFKSDHHSLYTQKLNKIALNFFDDKRIQCNDKITTYPYEYFDNTSNINDEIKNNTKELSKIDNSNIIPKNYNTNTPSKNNINNENVINEIIINNVDIYSDSANSACIDIIKCIDAIIDNTKCTTLVIIKIINTYTIIDIIKSIIAFIDNLKIIIVYIIRIINNKANNIKSICYTKRKSTKYFGIKKDNKYLDSTKNICYDKINSTNVNNIMKSTCADKIKAYTINANKNNNNTITYKKVKWELNMLSKIKKVTNKNNITTKKTNKLATSIKYDLNSLNKLKKVTNTPTNLINFLNMHINRIKNDNENIKNTHNILINKVHIENNSANSITKKTQLKVFNDIPKKVKSINNKNNVLKQIKQINKRHTKTNNAFIDFNKCKKAHSKLFINVLNQIKSNNNKHMQKSAGHKDSSANIINEVHTRDINNDVLLHNHILYHATKINNMHKCINNNQKNIASTLSNIYHDDIDTQFNKLSEVNDKLNSLLNYTSKIIFNKKLVKEQIILDAKVSINIRKYTPIIDNKRVCLLEIDEYLSNNIDNLRNNIKNKKYNEVLTMLLLICKHIIKSINRMRTHSKNKKDNNANIKVTSANNANNANKKVPSTNNANKKVTSTNNAIEKVPSTNTNKNVTSTNNTNKK